MPNIQIPEESFKRINVPGDGSCLFWAVALAYLTSVRDNNDLFQERFKRLFRSNRSTRGVVGTTTNSKSRLIVE